MIRPPGRTRRCHRPERCAKVVEMVECEEPDHGVERPVDPLRKVDDVPEVKPNLGPPLLNSRNRSSSVCDRSIPSTTIPRAASGAYSDPSRTPRLAPALPLETAEADERVHLPLDVRRAQACIAFFPARSKYSTCARCARRDSKPDSDAMLGTSRLRRRGSHASIDRLDGGRIVDVHSGRPPTERKPVRVVQSCRLRGRRKRRRDVAFRGFSEARAEHAARRAASRSIRR